ncbi:MAG: type I methionyl aminopeptidase [Chitinophagaceae bacterium]
MIYYKTQEEIELMRQSALMVSSTLAEAARYLKAGITTLQLDQFIEKYMLDNGAIPSFKGYQGFPNATCISVNDAVVHGIPNSYVLKEGDLVSVDCGVIMHDFHGDSAYTFALGEVKPEVLKLMGITKESLYLGINQAIGGNRIGDIGYSIQHYCEKEHGYGIVRELVGHGLGRDLHEDPQVPNYGRRGHGQVMKEGMVICIEPMINLGTREINYKNDGWTVVTKDGKSSAHYEHVVLVKKEQAEVLSSFKEIEKAEKTNANLNSSYY